MRGLEDEHLARRNGRLDAGFRVATDALTLGSVLERSEAGEFDVFSAQDRIADLFDHRFDELRRFETRETDAPENRIGKIRPRDCASGLGRSPLPAFEKSQEFAREFARRVSPNATVNGL